MPKWMRYLIIILHVDFSRNAVRAELLKLAGIFDLDI
jgi:hypothetical protein